MKKILPLLAILVVAVLLLSACGEPAYPADASHGDDDAHAEAAEGEHAATESEETEAQDMDNAEHDEAEETAPDADEAAENHDADMDTTEEPAEDAAEEPVAEEDSEQDSAENAEVTEAEEAEEVEEVEELAEAEATTSVGDPANGEALFNQMITEVSFACATCHRVDSDLQLIGPGLLGVAERTGERDPEATPEEYVHTSIINPDDYVVEGFSADLMPEVYTEIFTEQEIADLVSYVLSLEG